MQDPFFSAFKLFLWQLLGLQHLSGSDADLAVFVAEMGSTAFPKMTPKPGKNGHPQDPFNRLKIGEKWSEKGARLAIYVSPIAKRPTFTGKGHPRAHRKSGLLGSQNLGGPDSRIIRHPDSRTAGSPDRPILGGASDRRPGTNRDKKASGTLRFSRTVPQFTTDRAL